jgi:hypothetical protein
MVKPEFIHTNTKKIEEIIDKLNKILKEKTE